MVQRRPALRRIPILSSWHWLPWSSRRLPAVQARPQVRAVAVSHGWPSATRARAGGARGHEVIVQCPTKANETGHPAVNTFGGQISLPRQRAWSGNRPHRDRVPAPSATSRHARRAPGSVWSPWHGATGTLPSPRARAASGRGWQDPAMPSGLVPGRPHRTQH